MCRFVTIQAQQPNPQTMNYLSNETPRLYNKYKFLATICGL